MYANSETKIDLKKAKEKYSDIEEQYLMKVPYYARSGQDKYLNEEIFKEKRKGVFIDLGAYDGVESSNTLFFEATEEAGVPDLFLRFRKTLDPEDRNAFFIEEVKRASENIVYRLQDLQMKM